MSLSIRNAKTFVPSVTSILFDPVGNVAIGSTKLTFSIVIHCASVDSSSVVTIVGVTVGKPVSKVKILSAKTCVKPLNCPILPSTVILSPSLTT